MSLCLCGPENGRKGKMKNYTIHFKIRSRINQNRRIKLDLLNSEVAIKVTSIYSEYTM
jgi:hypothetical protein